MWTFIKAVFSRVFGQSIMAGSTGGLLVGGDVTLYRPSWVQDDSEVGANVDAFLACLDRLAVKF